MLDYKRQIRKPSSEGLNRLDPNIHGYFKSQSFNNILLLAKTIEEHLVSLNRQNFIHCNIFYSCNINECEEIQPTEEDILFKLREFDSQKGYVIKSHNQWDFIESEKANRPNVFEPKKNFHFVDQGEGLTVLINLFACANDQLPIIVIKTSFWENYQEKIIQCLKNYEPNEDYTAKISPAIYVELTEQ